MKKLWILVLVLFLWVACGKREQEPSPVDIALGECEYLSRTAPLEVDLCSIPSKTSL